MYKSVVILKNGTKIIGFHKTKEEAINTINLSKNNQFKESKIKRLK